MQTFLIGQDNLITPGEPGSTATQGTPSGSPGQPTGQQGGADFIFMMLIPLILFMFVMTFMTGRKDKRRRQEMMDSLQKHARVQTTGGVIGSVVEIRDTEVVLRVEEGRIRFAKAAIQSVLQEPVTKTDGGESAEA
ncbi:MAG: preprotein translocase subunit YajC [Phycisphaerales bacterium]|nr:preprotein translocase subunit YajC [Phycisphaerales bacterium]